MIALRNILALAALVAVAPVVAQTGVPGAADPSRVAAGSYKVDTNHTQVFWTLEHMGISPLSGGFGASGGSLEIDPAHLSAAKVSVTFNVAAMSTTAPAFTTHLSGPDLLDVTKFPVASFVSTSVVANGTDATVIGNLTLKGTTKPVTLAMKFHGAGINPMSKKLEIGFSGTTTIKRSEFGIGYALPIVGDEVRLNVTGVFEKLG